MDDAEIKNGVMLQELHQRWSSPSADAAFGEIDTLLETVGPDVVAKLLDFPRWCHVTFGPGVIQLLPPECT